MPVEKQSFGEEIMRRTLNHKKIPKNSIAVEIIEILRKHDVTRYELQEIFSEVKALINLYSGI